MKKFILTSCLPVFIFFVSYSQPKYEFRAVWIATVDNIDWPTKGNYNSASQKAEFIRQLDMHKRNGMNAVIVQVRPAADAFFPSQYEPWSEWLTGKQGKPPADYYDPLQFMIEETHKRGMEFHAWCNPYRAVFRLGYSSISPTHITRLHPDWFLTYGDTRYFDPGNKDVQKYVVTVIRDMLSRYDIDGLHLDDYFYPYRIPGREFPDNACYLKYGNGMNKEDWRRSNVDSIILRLSKAVRETKSHCKFGISPFGIWRNLDRDPEGSNTHAGQTNYDDLYADILLWLKNGWIDYVAPQVYFEFGHRAAAYEVLVDWWSKHSYGKQCYIGLGFYKAGSSAPWRDPTQIPRQVEMIRETRDVQGMIYFSSTSFNRNPYGWNDSLRENYYWYPALIPPMSWIDSTKPAAPIVRTEITKDSTTFYFLSETPDSVLRGYAIYLSDSARLVPDSALVNTVVPWGPGARFAIKNMPGEKGKKPYYFATAISMTNNESSPVLMLEGSMAAKND